MQRWVIETWSVQLLTLHLQSHPGQEAPSELVKQEGFSSPGLFGGVGLSSASG